MSEFLSAGVELRQQAGEGPKLGGLAAPTESYTTVKSSPRSKSMGKKGETREKFARGSFKNVVEQSKTGEKDVKVLQNHKGKPLASTKEGTLRLEDSADGLRFEMDLPTETPAGREILSAAETGKILGVSVSYNNPQKQSQLIKKGNSAIPPEQPSIIPTTIPNADKPMNGSTVAVGENRGTDWAVILDADVTELSIITQGLKPVYGGTSAELRAQIDQDEKIKLLCWVKIYEHL